MRLLAVLVLLFVLYVLLKGLSDFARLSRQRRTQREREGGEMVRDPVCETYILRARAIEKSVNGQTIYFCGPGCVDAYNKKGDGVLTQ